MTAPLEPRAGAPTPGQAATSGAIRDEYGLLAATSRAQGLDWMADMGEENVARFGAALAGEAELRTFLEEVSPSFASVTPDEIAARLGNLVSDVDRSAISGEAAAWLADVFRESVRNGIWGWHDDELAFVRPWGFDVADINLPVAIWQGHGIG